MASLRQFRKKIKSAKNISKLTRAMQLVAASKMKRAQEAATSHKEYAKGISDLSYLLSSVLDASIHPLLETKRVDTGKNLIILIGPEKGLCGSLVTNLAKETFSVVDQFSHKDVEFITIGKKANQIVKKMGTEVVAEFDMGLMHPKYEIVPPIARLIEERFLVGLAKSTQAIFSGFINTMSQVPQIRTLLPLSLVVQSPENENSEKKDYLFEPSAKDIVDPFLKMHLEVQIYQILLEGFASEQSARMVAMKNAQDNANNLLGVLSLEYNKVRQSIITSEILDIGNAKSALG